MKKTNIFIVNDSHKNLSNYIPKGIKIIKTRYPQRGAWSFAFQKACEAAGKSYKYFFCLHDDDTLKKNYLRTLKKALKQDTALSCISCSMDLLDDQGSLIKSSQFQFENEIFENTDQVCNHYVHHCIPFPPTFYRTRSVKNIKLCHDMKSFADGVFFTEIVKRGPIKILKSRLYNYRVHKKQVSKNTKRSEEIKFLVRLGEIATPSCLRIQQRISQRLTNTMLNDCLVNIFSTYREIKKARVKLSLCYALKKPKLLAKALLKLALSLPDLKSYCAIVDNLSCLPAKDLPRITIISFSCDRPMQLHALLDSLNTNLINPSSIFVIWKSTNQECSLGYQKVKNMFPSVSFIREKNMLFEIQNLIQESDAHIMFATDDSLLFETTKINSINNCESILAFSLRLGDNIAYSHPLGRAVRKPTIFKTDNLNIWKWGGADAEFGYPMSLDGHVFRKTFLIDALKNVTFTNPNQLEDQLHKKIKSGPPLWMVSFAQSHYVSNPINRVQDTFPNRCGNNNNDAPSELAKLYNSGKRIDIIKTISDLPIGCHQEYSLRFKDDR
jgi:hypothetical protein